METKKCRIYGFIGNTGDARKRETSAKKVGQDNRYVAPPPPKVTVALPVQQKVTRYLQATGYVAAVNTTNLVARVQGFLQAINYKDGEEVRKARPSSPSSRHRTSSSSSRHKPPRPARRPR